MDVQRRAAYPISEAAFLLGISRSGLYNLIDNGAIRRVKLGRRALIPADEIRRLVGSITTHDNEPPQDF